MPPALRGFARFAERRLRGLRWTYLGINLFLQLELTRAQVPLQRFGKCVEHLVSMLVLCHHAAVNDETSREVARLQAQLIKDKFGGIKILSALGEMQRTRDMIADVGSRLESGGCTLIDGVEPEAFAHPWDED
jgi:hypothetical protein